MQSELVDFPTTIPSENKRNENELNAVMDCNDRFGQLGCGLFDCFFCPFVVLAWKKSEHGSLSKFMIFTDTKRVANLCIG